MKSKKFLTFSLFLMLAVVVLPLVGGCAGKTTTVTTTKTVTATATATATKTVEVEVEKEFAVLNPRGLILEIERVPLSARLDTLDGKKIYVLGQKGASQIGGLYRALVAAYPKTTFVNVGKETFWGADEPTLWNIVLADGDGLVYGVAD